MITEIAPGNSILNNQRFDMEIDQIGERNRNYIAIKTHHFSRKEHAKDERPKRDITQNQVLGS